MAYIRDFTVVQVMACYLFDAKPSHEPMWTYHHLSHEKQISVKPQTFTLNKFQLKMSSAQLSQINYMSQDFLGLNYPCKMPLCVRTWPELV